ncbi:MAG: 3-phosphoshikimate 1-carboxyvinyltransferase [Myxococcota bacterium]
MTTRRESVLGARPLVGALYPPGDKSISHRALIFNAVAEGEALVRGLLDSADVDSTKRCLRGLGVQIEEVGLGEVIVYGRGWSLDEPAAVLDCGNSGTTMRLLGGLLAGQPMHVVLTGGGSLCKRPMGRIVEPLRKMGARIDGRVGGELAPLSIRGGALRNIDYRCPISSGQVKTAMLLAGLQGQGELVHHEPRVSRDHSERMLSAMGVAVRCFDRFVAVQGGSRLHAMDMDVPGDFSSSMFFLVGASVIGGSQLTLRSVGLNPTRTGGLDVLRKMGARIEVSDSQVVCGEPRGDLHVQYTPLTGVDIGGDDIPRLIDEIPILAIAAACARGETTIRDASELRVQGTDRIAATVKMLRCLGVEVEERPDGMVIDGRGGALEPTEIDSFGDHRIAMAGAIGLAATYGDRRGYVTRADAVSVSFPDFFPLLFALQTEHERLNTLT